MDLSGETSRSLIGDTIEYSMKELPRPILLVSVAITSVNRAVLLPRKSLTPSRLPILISKRSQRGHPIDDFVRGFTFNLNVLETFGNRWPNSVLPGNSGRSI